MNVDLKYIFLYPNYIHRWVLQWIWMEPLSMKLLPLFLLLNCVILGYRLANWWPLGKEQNKCPFKCVWVYSIFLCYIEPIVLRQRQLQLVQLVFHLLDWLPWLWYWIQLVYHQKIFLWLLPSIGFCKYLFLLRWFSRALQLICCLLLIFRDRFRTTVNVMCDSLGAILVNHLSRHDLKDIPCLEMVRL